MQTRAYRLHADVEVRVVRRADDDAVEGDTGGEQLVKRSKLPRAKNARAGSRAMDAAKGRRRTVGAPYLRPSASSCSIFGLRLERMFELGSTIVDLGLGEDTSP